MLYQVEIYDFPDNSDIEEDYLKSDPEIVLGVIDLSEISHLIEVRKHNRVNSDIPETKIILYSGFVINACITLKKATAEWQKYKDSQPITFEFQPYNNEAQPEQGEG